MKKLAQTTECVRMRECYTPQLNAEAVFFLRRLAWQQGKPMTQTLNALVLSATAQLSKFGNCQRCKGSKEQCSRCAVKSA